MNKTKFYQLLILLMLITCTIFNCTLPEENKDPTDTYTVVYNGNGNINGSIPADSNNYKEGETVTVLGNTGNLLRTAYSFSAWNTQVDGSGTTYTQGQTFTMDSANVILYAQWTTGYKQTITIDGVSFSLICLPVKEFKSGFEDSVGTATVPNEFWIGESEVTYLLWSIVFSWATHFDRGADRYYFANTGFMGDGSGDSVQHPVANINWRDALVWCNALTECYNANNGTSYTCVYKDNSVPIRDARAATADQVALFDNIIPDSSASGFRLLSRDEWDLAARYKADLNNDGDICDSNEYYPADFASGALADWTNSILTGLVGWFSENSGSPPGNTTNRSAHVIKTKAPNALGIYDMSGNMYEWIFGFSATKTHRPVRGGCWASSANGMQLKWTRYFETGYTEYPGDPAIVGFRFARTAD
jgi:sulfatase modifying factor 1